MSNSMIVMLTMLGVIASVGLFSFAKSLSPRHALMTAYAYLDKKIGDNAGSEKGVEINCLLNLQETNYAMIVGNYFTRAKEKQDWLVKEAVEIELTARQQLMLLDSLLNLNTRPEQAKKIIKVRSVKDIVELAVTYARDNRKIEAPLALFH